MRSRNLIVALTIIFGASIPFTPVVGESVLDRARRDQIVMVPDDDPEMIAAMAKARATLGDFLALARAPQVSMSGFAVKVAVRDGGNTEYFWITPFKEKDGGFTGMINNTPRTVKSVKFGQALAFSEKEIVDWLYVDGGKMKGNYTACVLLKRERKADADAAKARFGLECDYD
jgi:uncharacterized protein YegJ (DUF2314 family)